MKLISTSLFLRRSKIGALQIAYLSFPVKLRENYLQLPSITQALQLFTLKGLLRSFADSTELKVNYSKSFLVPINMNSDRPTTREYHGMPSGHPALYIPWLASGYNKTIC
jgi:hypothetical protein